MSRFHRKIGSWLGLFAILMATLAPAISHMLAARSDDATSGEHCSMESMESIGQMGSMPQMDAMASMSSMRDAASGETSVASHASSPPADPVSKSAQHTQLSDGDACGYCSLLAHLPVIPGVEALFVVAVRAHLHSVATRFESIRRVEPLTFAQPRAPPFAS